ncbi:MAG: hypothetical protein P8X79_10820 [Reinekea sp.]
MTAHWFPKVEPESVTPSRRSAQAIDSSLLSKNWGNLWVTYNF